MQIGIIGLGRMGMNMAQKLVKDGHEVIAWNRTKEKINEFTSKGGYSADSLPDLVQKLTTFRIIWSMLPSGEPTDEVLEQLLELAQRGDIVVNGANDHFENTERWAKKFADKNILFLGIGVSGGLIAATEGYPLMVGGDKEAFDKLKPIFETLAKPNGGYEYFGPGGSGHYVKMVHNAIEYGVMQSIGEGLELLSGGPYQDMDLVKVTSLWNKGTLLEGFLMKRTQEALEEDPKLEKIQGFVNDTGEGRWAIEVALKHSIPLSLITESLFKRYRSRQDDSLSAKVVAAMRKAFGGHKVKEK